MASLFNEIYNSSMQDPQSFWQKASEEITWFKKPTQIIDNKSKPHQHRWFQDGICNTCYNAVDRHVENGRGEQTAIIYDSPLTNSQQKITYETLQTRVAKFAGGLKNLGLKQGDRAIIYMPMIPETIIAMLACARIGVIHSVVFGGFAANELAVRIKDAEAKTIITTTCGIEPNRIINYMPMVNEAAEIAGNLVEHIIIFQRPEQHYAIQNTRDIDWQVLELDSAAVECTPVRATDPLYILYTSGTTGLPKGVVRDNGGHMVALQWSMKHIYDIKPGEVYWAASDVGWVVGHSYIVYAPLLYGCTSVLYEGKPVGTPDAGAFWRVISEHKVAVLFTAPTALRAVKKEDPEGKLMAQYDLSCMRTLFVAGERCDTDTLSWAEECLGKLVIDHWWQTETGWSISANCLGIEQLPVRAGSSGRAMPGYDIHILGEDNQVVRNGEMGAICVKLPLPPGCFPSLWNAGERFESSYFSNYLGYYETGDAGYIDNDGYIFVMARTDDIINVAGHRLSTGAMEEVLSAYSQVAEAVVFGVSDSLKGQLPVGLIVLKDVRGDMNEADMNEAGICEQAVNLVRSMIGPVAAFKSCAVVKRLPKTRSGKILRGVMSKIADGVDYKVPPTIEDPEILTEIAHALHKLGYPTRSGL